MMNFEVRVVEPNDFKAYLDYREANPRPPTPRRWRPSARIVGTTTFPFDSRRGEQVGAPAYATK
jgi:cytochrome c oxidase subunit 2